MNYMYPNYQMATPSLNGKVVDGIDMVKATEVPIGGFGVFPKADLSEIYIKSWNVNGTINTVTYKPSVEQKEESLLDKIEQLEKKIDSLVQQKEEKINEY